MDDGRLTGLLCRFGCILRGSLRLELGELEPSMRRSGIVYLWSWLGGGIRGISSVGGGGSRTRKRATCSGEVGRERSRYAININRYTDTAGADIMLHTQPCPTILMHPYGTI